jgi:HEAT repeat protein
MVSGPIVVGQDKAGEPAEHTGSVAEADLLELSKAALTNPGSDDQMRLNGANILLFHESPMARAFLLEVLGKSDNGAARMAVCKSLIKARAEQKPPARSEDFIVPLMEILRTEADFMVADLAAEASLIFEYEQVCEQLEAMTMDGSLAGRARLNAIEALKRPDIGAVCQLMRLVDDGQKEVVKGAEQALRSLGMPAGANAEARAEIIEQLQRKGKDEFLRDWVIRQDGRIRELEGELNWWKAQLLEVLDSGYKMIEDDVAKGRFLAERLVSPKKAIKLWALTEVSEWHKGTNPKLPDELGPVLVDLVSDAERDVRLRVAKLLSRMGELNAAEKLLEQHNVEQDDAVRMEIFVAFGVACSHASMSNSIPAGTRKACLELASEYLFDGNAGKSQAGADVIGKLLEQNELGSGEVAQYLGCLLDRCEQDRDNVDGALRAGLLSTMAGLCGPGSACRIESAELFAALFEEALDDKTDLVREAAVDGLIHIDSSEALNRLRESDLINDPRLEIRKKLVNLAGEVGGKEELPWLWDKVGLAEESRSAWEAMLKIFGSRSESAVLAQWINKLEQGAQAGRVSDEQYLSFLELSEPKVAGDTDKQTVRTVRRRLARLYHKGGDFEQAARYFGILRKAAETPEQKESILGDLLDSYLRWPNVEMAAWLVDNCLDRKKDLELDGPVIQTIERYLSEPPAEADVSEVLSGLFGAIKPVAGHPRWQAQVKAWNERLMRGKKPDEAGASEN